MERSDETNNMNKHNMIKNPNWQEADRPLSFVPMAVDVEKFDGISNAKHSTVNKNGRGIHPITRRKAAPFSGFRYRKR